MTAVVSVALCTHNGERYIEAQMRSILDQDRPPAEIVLSDDSSVDSTVAIVERVVAEWGPEAPRLIILRNPEPLGVVLNFEQAVRATTGDLIALCDQDDVWHPGRLRALVGRFERNPELLLVHSDARLVDDRGVPLGHSLLEALEVTSTELEEIRSGRAFGALLKRNLVTGATVVASRSLIDRAVPFPEPWVHDEWLAVVAAATGELELVRDELIDYRQHGANQIGVRKLSIPQKIRRLFEPRDDRYRYLTRRAEVLVARLADLGTLVPDARLVMAREKSLHQRARSALPRTRILRVPAVLREAATGRYALYSRGRADIARDILQPAGV